MKKIAEVLRWITKKLGGPSSEFEQACIEFVNERNKAIEEATKQAELDKLQMMQRIERIDKNLNFIANHIRKQYHYYERKNKNKHYDKTTVVQNCQFNQDANA